MTDEVKPRVAELWKKAGLPAAVAAAFPAP